MTAMKKRMILATLSSLLLCMAACSNKQLPTSEDILTEARAVKTLNAYDEMNCVVYDMKVTPASPKSSIDRFVSDDCVEVLKSDTLFPAILPKRNRCISSKVVETTAVIYLFILWDFPFG